MIIDNQLYSINDISQSYSVRYFCGIRIPAISMVSHEISWWDIFPLQVIQVIQVIQLIQVMQVRLAYLWPDFRIIIIEEKYCFKYYIRI